MKKLKVLFVLSLVWIFLTSCKSPPTNFYVLSSNVSAMHSNKQAMRKQSMGVGIGPIELPNYMDRQEMVVHETPYQVIVEEFHRWAEPLRDNIARVLTENLAYKVPRDSFVVYPWKMSDNVKYSVAIKINYFGADYQGNCILNAKYTLRNEESQEVLLVKEVHYVHKINTFSYQAIAEGMSKNLFSLSQEVGKRLSSVGLAAS